jgi:monoamine oxidase
MPDLLSRRQALFASAFLLSAACKATSPAPTVAPSPVPGPRKVVIVGAGISGLAIALELEKRGWDPLVLEAANRVGGRVLTLREPFRDGRYVEAGATHIVPDPDLSALIEEMQVGLVQRPRPSPTSPASSACRAKVVASPAAAIVCR